MDKVNNTKYAVAIKAGSSTSDTTAVTGEIVDRAGYNSVTFVLETGTLADADATFAVKLVHGDAADLADGADVTSADLIGDFDGFQYDDDDTCFKLGYAGAKRYVRMVVTPTGNSGAAGMAGICVLQDTRKYPIA